MAELKSCPFCGGEADTAYNTRFNHQVFCTNDECFMNTITMYGMATEAEAVAAWNRRTEYEPKPKPTTNADRIRAMANEELADYHAKLQLLGEYGVDSEKTELCKKLWLTWLQSPADGGDGDG